MQQSRVSKGLEWPPELISILFVAIAIEIGLVWFGVQHRRAVFEQVRAILLPQPPRTVAELRSELGSLVREEHHPEIHLENGNTRVTFWLSNISKFLIAVDYKPDSGEIETTRLIFSFSEEVDLETGKGLGLMLPVPALLGGIVASCAIAWGWIAIHPQLRRWQQIVAGPLLLVGGITIALFLMIPLVSFYLF